MDIVSWVLIIAGVITIILSLFTFRRKGESELSSNVIETPMFRIGAVAGIIGIILKIVAAIL